MCKWKLVWKSAMFHLRQEMKNPRFLLSFVLAFVLCLMLSDKAVFFAESYGTSMQVFETFILQGSQKISGYGVSFYMYFL